MKTNIIIITAILALLCGCASSTMIYDQSVPEEETAIITPSTDVMITSFNGEKVRWTSGFWTGPIAIPAGKVDLVIDYYAERGSIILYGNNVSFSYDFKKGQIYNIGIAYGTKEKVTISVFNRTTKKGEKITVYSNETAENG